MRLLVDENIHPIVVARLREAGFAVEWIKRSSPGAQDFEILTRPDIGEQIFVTHDRDFGDLVFNKRMPVPRAILYVRLPHRQPERTADRLIALLEAGIAPDQMITLTKDGVRTKPFPAGASNG